MKIYYDYQALTMQRFGGISRYYYELISRLQDIRDADIEVSAFLSQNEYFNGFPGVISAKPYHWRIGQLINRLNRSLSLKKINNGRYDIIHPTYYDPYFLSDDKVKKVITVHDMTQEMMPEYYAGDPVIEQKKENIYKADHIIAISENTRKDILELYPDIKAEKITVIYHGSTRLNPSGVEPSIELPKEYVLFVGNRYTYKNFKKLFEALGPVFEKSNIHLICAGGGSFTDQEKEMIGKYRDRVHQYSMSDADLQKAYSDALCFVFPSMYEGFGLPVLEAFECGCPVVMSNTSSLPEVGGDVADYFDPTDAGSIRETVGSVINRGDENRSEEALKKRMKQAGKFTWNEAADRLYECYKGVLQ